LHFFQANWAFSGLFGAIGVNFEGIKQFFGLLGVAEQYFELSGVEPDTAAVGAEINLDVGELKGNHRVFANRTIHKNSALSQKRIFLWGYITLGGLLSQEKAGGQGVFFWAKRDWQWD